MIKEYQKHIAGNRNLVYISTAFLILIRLLFLFTINSPVPEVESFVLNNFVFLFENRYILFVVSLLLTIGVGVQVSHLNEKYALVRGKTSLPYVFTILLLSASPDYMYLIFPYIGVVAILASINILFSAYHEPKASKQAFKIGFILSLSTFFVHEVLIYLIVFWIGFLLLRSFSFKAFLASISAVAMIFWLVLSYFFFFRKQEEILNFLEFEWYNFQNFSILQMDAIDIVLLATYTIIVVAVLINDYVNEFKDKIQIRLSFSILKLTLFFSGLMYFFLPVHSLFNLIVATILSGFILSHFFALANKKWKIYFFIFLIIFYLTSYGRLLIE